MLKKAHISSIKSGSDAWYMARLGKFTSSEIHYLTFPRGFTDQSLAYIRRKVGEELTGKPAKEDIDTNATRHGLMHEATAVRKFGKQVGLEFIIVQQLITDPATRFGSTPDGLIVLRESPDKTEYEVETLEVKCPPSFDGYILLYECETPGDLKKKKREYYWQVLDQMLQCGAKQGHLVIYHPDFKAGNHKTITFNPLHPVLTSKGKTFPIFNDLKLLRERKELGLVKFDEIRSKLMAGTGSIENYFMKEKIAICYKCGFREHYEPDEFGLQYYQAIGICPFCDNAMVDENGKPTKEIVSFTITDEEKGKSKLDI